MKKLSLALFLCTAVTHGFSQSTCNCDVTITQSGYYNGNNMNVQPGKTICIQAGTYSYLTFANLRGSASNPITIKNCGGSVILDGTGNTSGISFSNSQYFKLTGTGDLQYPYGIKIQRTGSVGAISASNLSSDFEIEYIEIAGAEYAGIMAKTDPTCDSTTWRQNFTMSNVSIHNNYIHDINGKGMMIGYNAASVTRSCAGQTSVLYPHDAVGLKIYENIIDKVGGEGILCANASESAIYSNTITTAGLKSTSAGILLGSNMGGQVYNNQIISPSGNGFSIIGYLGGNQIYNNVVAKPKLNGIYIDDRPETQDNSTVLLANNTVVETGGAGIRLDNEKSNNTVINNALVKPGSNVPVSVLQNVQVVDQNNYKGSLSATALFVNPAAFDYHLLATSALINGGQSVSGRGIQTDIEGNPRAMNGAPDIGAYEYQIAPVTGCKVTISQNGSYNAAQLGVGPGEKICIQAGTYSRIAIANILGTANNPVTVVNFGGQVTLDGATNPTGLALSNCKYVKLTGSGDTQNQYGIKVQQTGPGASGVNIGSLSDYVEVERIEVAGADFAGIMIKTDPTCDPATWRQNFTMRDVKVHHNYIHDVKGEGIYIGNSFFSEGLSRTCDGKTVTVYPHNIVGLEVYENRTERTGAEGIQYGCATDAEVHHNTVIDAGRTPFAAYQSNGIQIGAGSGGRLYNNIIKNSDADGVVMVGHLGNNKIFNNLITDSGEYGIFCDDRPGSIPNTPVLIANNTVVRARLDGISLFNEINYNTIVNNVIMFPGSGFYIYANSGVPYADQNNFKSSDYSNNTFVNIANGDYHPIAGSPLIDSGRDVSGYGITKDLDDKTRPINGKYDIGAYEYGTSANARIGAEVNSESVVNVVAFPSPCINTVTIQSKSEHLIKGVTVYAPSAAQVMHITSGQPTASVELATGDLPAGTYLVHVIDSANQSHTTKFVKQ